MHSLNLGLRPHTGLISRAFKCPEEQYFGLLVPPRKIHCENQQMQRAQETGAGTKHSYIKCKIKYQIFTFT